MNRNLVSPQSRKTIGLLRWASIGAAVVGSLAIERVALAGETESRTLFGEGRELREQHRCKEAIVVFRKALETYPEGLGSLRNIAECDTELGFFASARREWGDLRLAAIQSASPKYETWAKDAEEARDSLAPKVAKVTIKLTGTRPEGLRLQVNGKSFDPRLLDTELEEDNGPLVVEAYYGGSQPVTQQVEVKEKDRLVVTLDLPKPGTFVPVTSPGGNPIVEKSNARQNMLIGGGVGLGLGGLAAIGMGIAIGIRQAAISDLNGACTTTPQGLVCDATKNPDVRGLQTKADTASIFVDALAATAVVGVGIGLTLVLIAPSDTDKKGDDKKGNEKKVPGPVAPSPPKTSLQLDFRPTYGGGTMTLGGSF